MKVAVVGSGIAGLTVAHGMQHDADLHVFEAADYAGGHTHTVDVEEQDGRPLAVDTGFIVFNHRNYPGFSALLAGLGVQDRPSEMSFSVRDERTGLEYRGSSLDTLFAQRRNLVRPRFLRMLADLVRFYRSAPGLLDTPEADRPLGEFLLAHGYSRGFIEDHLVPMANALWSSGTHETLSMPIGFLIRFFDNHHMLSLRGRPKWRVVEGGSREYVRALTRPLGDRLHLRSPVEAIRRDGDGPALRVRGEWIRFDRVVLALHSNQALRLLQDPTAAEIEVLGSMAYRPNEVVLHTDRRFLPVREKAWSSWNYHITGESSGKPTVTYYMNRLQGFQARRPYLVTLNRTRQIAPEHVLRRFVYDHPVFDRAAVAAQTRHAEVSGPNGTYYAGAYWGFGFHEDGVQSGLRVIEALRAARHGMQVA